MTALPGPRQRTPEWWDFIVERLTSARDRISEDRWCTHYRARDGSGDPVEPLDERAEQWCAYGSMQAEGPFVGMSRPFGLLSNSAQELYGTDLASVNDVFGQAAVLRVYDRAIAKARARELH